MAPRRAAAVSAASSISQTAGPSTPAAAKNGAKEARQSSGGQQQASSSAKTPTALPIAPVQPLSPIVARLRKMWKFAAVCQFLFTFDEAFGMSGFETEALENDLDGSEKKVIPDLMRRLLYTLTLNRSIDEYNWEDHLRAQYLARHPEETLLGTIEEPFPWSGLPLWQKVETLHQACEWQLWDAERFRKLVKNEEEAHVWRIDPIGWDSKDNTYWLFDDNRLWIQYPRPAPTKAKAPPKKNSKKARLEAAAAKRAAQKAQSQGQSQKRKREDVKPKSTPTRASARNRVESAVIESPAPKRGKSSRRSNAAKDDWEEIPPELLYEEESRGVSKGDDEESELSDPPPAEEEDVSMADDIKAEGDGADDTKGDLSEDAKEEVNSPKENGVEDSAEVGGEVKEEIKEPIDDWIEFETIAVTKQDWEAISVQFAKSKHPDEKSLHQLLKTEVLPKVMADLEEAERQRAHEAAMANRKRSSRIALKESEREEKERDRVARLKMEEKMAAIRADEERQKLKDREERDAAKIREERLREREDRMAAREREAIERAEKEILDRENREKLREMRKMKREQIIANGGMINESEELQQSKADDEDSWELNCEVCGASGINPDDTAEIVCCETCGRWQHTECWNAFDRKVGRPGRNWEEEDFFCSSCKPPGPGQPWPRPTVKPDHNGTTATGTTTTQGVPRPPTASPSLGSQFSHSQPVIAPQRPISAPGTPLYPNTYMNHSVRPAVSSPNGQGQHWSHQQQQQYHSHQQQQQLYSPQHQHQPQALPQNQHLQQHQYQLQQQPQNHPSYYTMQQRLPYPQQQVPQPMYSQAPAHPQYMQQQQQQQQLQYQQQQQQQQQQQRNYSNMASYSPPAQGYSNGHSYVSQAPLSSPSYQAQITPQHMQRPLPVLSPSQAWPKSSDRGTSHTTFNDSKGNMHAPPPISHGQSNRLAGALSSPRASPASQARPIAAQPSPQQSPRPSSQPPLVSPARSTAALPSPPASIGAPARPPPMLSNPFASAASPARSDAVTAALSPAGANIAQKPASTLLSPSSPQPPTGSSQTAPISPNALRSPTPSPKTTSGVPRNIANLPSGTFPLRRNSAAKSPLSRPEGYTSPSIPAINLGPTIGRATSPSPINRSPTSNAKQDPLYNRQTVLSTASTNTTSLGPGPSTGSLARAPQTAAASQTTSVAAPPAASQPKADAPLLPQAKILGPSPPRPVFGGAPMPSILTSTSATSAVQTPPAMTQANQTPASRPTQQQSTPQDVQQGESQP